ncbi:hypothetical protein CGCF413_v014386 [Colletotrichum fructicola]|nr:hypothetical protein CGCF413_v014386 [Colletotrichum fructicola]
MDGKWNGTALDRFAAEGIHMDFGGTLTLLVVYLRRFPNPPLLPEHHHHHHLYLYLFHAPDDDHDHNVDNNDRNRSTRRSPPTSRATTAPASARPLHITLSFIEYRGPPPPAVQHPTGLDAFSTFLTSYSKRPIYPNELRMH